MGDKITAKDTMKKLGVPCVPGRVHDGSKKTAGQLRSIVATYKCMSFLKHPFMYVNIEGCLKEIHTNTCPS